MHEPLHEFKLKMKSDLAQYYSKLKETSENVTSIIWVIFTKYNSTESSCNVLL